jgi:hypothetical protein
VETLGRVAEGGIGPDIAADRIDLRLYMNTPERVSNFVSAPFAATSLPLLVKKQRPPKGHHSLRR